MQTALSSRQDQLYQDGKQNQRPAIAGGEPIQQIQKPTEWHMDNIGKFKGKKHKLTP